jgi:hypothetical protein
MVIAREKNIGNVKFQTAKAVQVNYCPGTGGCRD